jgi:hypothetical protein
MLWRKRRIIRSIWLYSQTPTQNRPHSPKEKSARVVKLKSLRLNISGVAILVFKSWAILVIILEGCIAVSASEKVWWTSWLCEKEWRKTLYQGL